MGKSDDSECEDLAFLRQVFQDMTHEIAAPLTPLFGHLDLLELRTNDQLSPMQRRCMQAMRRSLRRLTSINDRLLELARIERGHIPCEPNALIPEQIVTEIVRRHQSAAKERHISLEQRFPPEPAPQILADWHLLGLAISHLVDNALRFAMVRSSLIFEILPGEKTCCLSVIDQGPGVPVTELSMLTRPFYRITDEEAYTETAGLGLTIVNLIARRLGGRLEFELTNPDDPDSPGLTARLHLPVAL